MDSIVDFSAYSITISILIVHLNFSKIVWKIRDALVYTTDQFQLYEL